jgi:hypothetical protein
MLQNYWYTENNQRDLKIDIFICFLIIVIKKVIIIDVTKIMLSSIYQNIQKD